MQVAQGIDDPGKEEQEKCSLKEVSDRFRKIIVVRDALMPYYDNDSFLIIGLSDFLLDKNSMDP